MKNGDNTRKALAYQCENEERELSHKRIADMSNILHVKLCEGHSPADRKTLTETNNEQKGGGRETEILDSPPSGGSDYFINFYHLLCFQGLHSETRQAKGAFRNKNSFARTRAASDHKQLLSPFSKRPPLLRSRKEAQTPASSSRSAAILLGRFREGCQASRGASLLTEIHHARTLYSIECRGGMRLRNAEDIRPAATKQAAKGGHKIRMDENRIVLVKVWRVWVFRNAFLLTRKCDIFHINGQFRTPAR
ncbi:hypothetical protein CDAR_220121 [Caerostris darwini]|uniref:Uncharacterized protein n=1 Tax=Caerostris darwini TaxID=1538125 RepID=A0AAV4VJD1_9ARAC|nr:hypothetical protein CDAR_220121 [Caerostris darwini]